MFDLSLSVAFTVVVLRVLQALRIVAKAYHQAEVDYLRRHGADFVVLGEQEIAKGLAGYVADTTTAHSPS